MTSRTASFLDTQPDTDLLHRSHSAIPEGSFLGADIEPGTFHAVPRTLAPDRGWVDDRPDVNEALNRPNIVMGS